MNQLVAKWTSFLAALFIVIGCGSGKRVSNSQETKPYPCGPYEESDFLSWSRFKCRGSCQVYELTLHRDGSLTLNAKENLPIQGAFTARIDPEEACAILEKAATCLPELTGPYYPNVSDYQQMELRSSLQNVDKLVKGKQGAPICLEPLVEIMEGFLSKAEWKELK